MAPYLLRRALIALVLALIAGTLVFMILRLVPGDVVDAMMAEGGATPEQIQIMKDNLGLNEPVIGQYMTWVQGVLQGDLGTSMVTGRSVTMDVIDTFPRTLELIIGATVVSWLLGVPAGVYAATRHNTLGDYLTSFVSLVGLSIPVFVTAALLILLFSFTLGWLPASGYVPFRDDPGRHLQLLILPCLSIAIIFGGTLMRMTRASLLDVLRQDYVRTARSKGLREHIVVYKHALRNALIPVVTTSGLQMGQLLGGTVIVEYVFNYPGVSTLLIQSVQRRDYPVVQGALLVIALTFICINLLIDVVNAYLDPKIRLR